MQQASQASQTSQADRQRQLEQLAGLGVNIPGQLRGDMAMVGEWTVTSTRTIGEAQGDGAAATTGRKRELEKTEDQLAEEEAVRGLFKRPKKWGRDSRTEPAQNDAELDALLTRPLTRPTKEEPAAKVPVKMEDSTEGDGQQGGAEKTTEAPPIIKQESGSPTADLPESGETAPAATVVFKKRKARQK